MSMNFTVIQDLRQHFATNKPGTDCTGCDGLSKTYSFRCPDIDNSKIAMFQFKVRYTAPANRNTLKINGHIINSDIRSLHSSRHYGCNDATTPVKTNHYINDLTSPHPLLISANVLQENNLLEIISGDNSLIIDKVVVIYKVKTPSVAKLG